MQHGCQEAGYSKVTSQWCSFPEQTALRALAHGCVGQTICLYVVFARHVRDGEFEGASQLAAGPMERIEAWAAANVLAAHLPDDHLGVGVDVQGLRLQRNGALQGFHQGHVFGNVIILMADPLGDANGAAGAAFDNHPNTRWPRITQATTIHVGH